MPIRISPLALLVLALLVTGCDQGTKRWAERRLSDSPITLVSGRFELAHHENRGMAFNTERVLPSAVRLPLILIAGVVLVGILSVAWYRRRHEVSAWTAGYALVLGGAAGNLIDRGVRGHVVDFIHLHGWPVFNVADIAIAVGGALLVLASWRSKSTSPG